MTIEPAFLHSGELQKRYAVAIAEQRALFYTSSSWRSFKLAVDDSEWERIQRVSVSGAELHGYLAALVDRDVPAIYEMAAISFVPGSLSFGRDLAAFVGGLCFGRWERIGWSVVAGNPIEPMYDRMVGRLGGRVVGVTRRSVITGDGVLRDRKLYEVIPADVPQVERDRIEKLVFGRTGQKMARTR